MVTISNERLIELALQMTSVQFMGINRTQVIYGHEMRAILSELQSLRSQAGVSEAVAWEVKPLDWQQDGKWGRAVTPIGVYQIGFVGGAWCAYFWGLSLDPDAIKPTVYDSQFEALEAVNSDYRQRISSCLSSDFARPAPIEITEAVDRALNEAEAWNEAEGDPADTLHHGRSVIEKFRAALQGETK